MSGNIRGSAILLILDYISSLDIFGGAQVKFQDLVKENTLRQAKNQGNSLSPRDI
jgi:hypothetical protein